MFLQTRESFSEYWLLVTPNDDGHVCLHEFCYPSYFPQTAYWLEFADFDEGGLWNSCGRHETKLRGPRFGGLVFDYLDQNDSWKDLGVTKILVL